MLNFLPVVLVWMIPTNDELEALAQGEVTEEATHMLAELSEPVLGTVPSTRLSYGSTNDDSNDKSPGGTQYVNLWDNVGDSTFSVNP